MPDFPQIITEHTRRSMGTYKRGISEGRKQLRDEVLSEVEKMNDLKTEFEVREQLPKLIEWLRSQE